MGNPLVGHRIHAEWKIAIFDKKSLFNSQTVPLSMYPKDLGIELARSCHQLMRRSGMQALSEIVQTRRL